VELPSRQRESNRSNEHDPSLRQAPHRTPTSTGVDRLVALPLLPSRACCWIRSPSAPSLNLVHFNINRFPASQSIDHDANKIRPPISPITSALPGFFFLLPPPLPQAACRLHFIRTQAPVQHHIAGNPPNSPRFTPLRFRPPNTHQRLIHPSAATTLVRRHRYYLAQPYSPPPAPSPDHDVE